MWFPPYPAPSIARSALPDAPVQDDLVPDDRDDAVRDGSAPPLRHRRQPEARGGRRRFPADARATPRLT